MKTKTPVLNSIKAIPALAGSGTSKIKVKSSFGSVRLANENDKSMDKDDGKDDDKDDDKEKVNL